MLLARRCQGCNLHHSQDARSVVSYVTSSYLVVLFCQSPRPQYFLRALSPFQGCAISTPLLASSVLPSLALECPRLRIFQVVGFPLVHGYTVNHQGRCLHLWYRRRVGRYGETVAESCHCPRPEHFQRILTLPQRKDKSPFTIACSSVTSPLTAASRNLIPMAAPADAVLMPPAAVAVATGMAIN